MGNSTDEARKGRVSLYLDFKKHYIDFFSYHVKIDFTFINVHSKCRQTDPNITTF